MAKTKRDLKVALAVAALKPYLERALTDSEYRDDLVKTVTGKNTKRKKSHKGRNTVLLAGLAAGALYNPWSGTQTRSWLKSKVAGNDPQPLDDFATFATDKSGNGGSTVENVTETIADAAATSVPTDQTTK